MHISWNEVKKYRILKPTDTILKHFEEITSPIIEDIQVLSDKIKTLEQTRDLILPMLIRGKINIDNLVEVDTIKQFQIE
jgi:type I restriction enzyme S subunit